MAVEARLELVGKRFLCVSGDEPPEIGDIGRWPWRSGVIRAVNHRDSDSPDLTKVALSVTCICDSLQFTVYSLTALGSSFSERLLHPRCVKERYRRSFLPAAVRLHNKLGYHCGAEFSSGEEAVPEPAGPGEESPMVPLRGEDGKQCVTGWPKTEVFMPDCDAVGKDALDGEDVKVHQKLGRKMDLHESPQEEETLVYVEFDDQEWEKREWVKVYEDFQLFLLEHQLVWAKRKEGAGGAGAGGGAGGLLQGTKAKHIQWPALTHWNSSCALLMGLLAREQTSQLWILDLIAGTFDIFLEQFKFSLRYVLATVVPYHSAFKPVVGKSLLSSVTAVEFLLDRQLDFLSDRSAYQPYQVRGLFGLCTTRSRSLVRIAGSKSDLFPVHVGLRQGCPLSPVLFIIFMDRISRRSQGPEGVRFGNHRISSLLFADDVVLLASSSQDLQHVLERFAAECEAAGMRISTSKSEAMVTRPEKGGVPSPGGWRGPASSGGVQVSRGLVHE
ncbi:hypothetical protein L3Q82_010436 [Scortum barcoo]|uniref:Uncharacterized protein n=1 Tax=Scortum barcoo TaxID=214431 RepID=A0ACB8WD17_9TELE|nr:hypothetical protein L3Q82_010436 [Scortum barcoo]